MNNKIELKKYKVYKDLFTLLKLLSKLEYKYDFYYEECKEFSTVEVGIGITKYNSDNIITESSALVRVQREKLQNKSELENMIVICRDMFINLINNEIIREIKSLSNGSSNRVD